VDLCVRGVGDGEEAGRRRERPLTWTPRSWSGNAQTLQKAASGPPWREDGKTRNVLPGERQERKMDAAEARRKTRERKAEGLGIAGVAYGRIESIDWLDRFCLNISDYVRA
jgi:hypothetical protein